MDLEWGTNALILLGSYLLGSIPSAYIYGRIKGVDIRKVGSGNPGATNVMRTFGTVPGILVLLLDACKGFIPVYLVTQLSPYPVSDWIRVSCGLAAILGHTFTCFLNFKGGKGVATTCGVFLGLAPKATLLVLIPFILVVAVTRYISAGSILAAFVFPFLIWFMNETGQHAQVLVASILIAGMIIIRHRSNVSRILNGTENKFGQRIDASPKNKA